MKQYQKPDMVKVVIDAKEAFSANYDGGCSVGAGWNFENVGDTYCYDVGGPWQTIDGDYECFANNMGP